MDKVAFQITRRSLLVSLLAALVLLTGCARTGVPASPAAVATAAVASAPAAAPIVVHTVVVTATPLPAPSTYAYSPEAKLIRISPAGKCRWTIYMALTGFAPNSSITVNSKYDEVVCATGEVVTGASWKAVYGARTDANGRLVIDYLHEATGAYHYVFTDELGNQASLPFTTEPEPTATPRGKTPATTTAAATAIGAAPTVVPTVVRDPQAIVQSATLNLRGGPGQNYPIMGKVARGDKLYPVARTANCQWLQAGVLGRSELVWVAAGPQFVTLNVPCETLRVVDELPPTPVPAPTALPAPTAVPAPIAASRPATDLLSRSSSGSGPGELLIKNGTDSDGVVLLVDAAGSPVQAAYIRAGESFRMTQIADGTYRLYFSKGEGWNAARKEFARNITRQRFADTLTFVSPGGQYTTYEVTLYGVAGGNAATQNVPAGQFPAVP
jgi:hypothetical protein